MNLKTMKKLLELQKQVGAISKDSENPFFKSKYFDINKLLETIKPILNKLEIVILQPLRNVNGRPAIGTVLIDTSDNAETKTLLDETITLPDLTDPQKMGSAITYYRRYSLQSALGLEAEDDDGNVASNKVEVKSVVNEKTLEDIKSKELSKQEQIAILCVKLGIEDKSKKGYEYFVFANTTHVLKESNYDLIIDKLNKRLAKK